MSMLPVNPVGPTIRDVQPFLTIFTATTLGHITSTSLLGMALVSQLDRLLLPLPPTLLPSVHQSSQSNQMLVPISLRLIVLL